MKKNLQIIALLLLTVLLFTLVSCNQSNAEEEIPDGMKVACCAGADYRLFVPSTWNLNTAYGVSGAYLNLVHQSTVSVNKYETDSDLGAKLPVENPARNEYFFREKVLSVINGIALNAVADLEESATTLDGENARRYAYSAIVNGETLHYVQVLCEKDSAFYLFSFVSTTEYYDLCIDAVEQMLEVFRFDVPYEPEDALLIDDSTEAPDGMQALFNKKVAYRFYVPADWEITRNDEIYSAYSKADRANVSVSPYLPEDDGMSVAAFFELTKEQMQKALPANAFELLSETQTTLGGRDAVAYEYRLTVDGQVFHCLQTVCVYKTMIYNLTYTAKEADFNAHLEELDRMVANFSFR